MRIYLVCVLMLAVTVASSQGPVPKYGAISTAHPEATKAGMDVLKKGGNAFDAFVAVAAVLNVVEPTNSGIGGYGTILIYDASKKRIRYLNSSGRIPKLTDADLMRPPTVDYLKNRSGAKAISTPSNLNAWKALHKQYGNLSWRVLFEAAIEKAITGTIVNVPLSRAINMNFSRMSAYSRNIYGNSGSPLKQGDTLKQNDLATTLQRIAIEGTGAFYAGKTADAIDNESKKAGGFLRKQDLLNDKAEWWNPIQMDYKGYQVYSASPPSNAFAGLIFLELLKRHQLQLSNDSLFYHLIAEIGKQSYYARVKYSVDPELSNFSLSDLLNQTVIKELDDRIDIIKATPYPGNNFNQQGSNTTHFVIADKWGNIVSATQTLGNLFGSCIMPEGTGVWLNNSLEYSTFEPKGNPMDAFAGHHKLSGDCPVIILKNGLPWAALGSPGGHTITQNVPQIISALIDKGMTMQEAIDFPKLSFIEPDLIIADNFINPAFVKMLEAKGHKIRYGSIGNAHGIIIRTNNKGKIMNYDAGSDKRGIGSVLVE
jgi:gamma-glutamyltranspeptidase/glutathione hydrolase